MQSLGDYGLPRKLLVSWLTEAEAEAEAVVAGDR